jgi:hypothetical protein
LTGAVEVQLKVERAGDLQVLVTVQFAKDFPEGAEIASRLESVELGTDEDGDPVTSLIVLPTDHAPAARDKAEKLTKNQKTMFSILHDAGRGGLTLERWNELGREAGIGRNRQADLYDCRTALHKKGLVTETMNGWTVKQSAAEVPV